MPIVAADIKFYKSNGAESDGGTIAAAEITDATLENLFDDVTADEGEDGLIDYRKMFLKNAHATISWGNIVAWILSLTSSDDDEISIGLGTSNDLDGTNELSQPSTTTVIRAKSSGGDTRTLNLVGEDSVGNRQTDTIVLNGTNYVNGTQGFSRLYTAYVTVTDGSRTITIEELGGTVLGTIPPPDISTIGYLRPTNKTDGLKIGSLAALASQGIWIKRVVAAGAEAFSANSATIKCEGETS